MSLYLDCNMKVSINKTKQELLKTDDLKRGNVYVLVSSNPLNQYAPLLNRLALEEDPILITVTNTCTLVAVTLRGAEVFNMSVFKESSSCWKLCDAELKVTIPS